MPNLRSPGEWERLGPLPEGCEPNRTRNPALWIARAESGCGEGSAACVLACSYTVPLRSATPSVEHTPRRSAQSLGGLARHRPRPGEASRAGHLHGNSSSQPGLRPCSRPVAPLGRSRWVRRVRWAVRPLSAGPPETGGRFGFTWGRRRVGQVQSDQRTPLRNESNCKPTRPP